MHSLDIRSYKTAQICEMAPETTIFQPTAQTDSLTRSLAAMLSAVQCDTQMGHSNLIDQNTYCNVIHDIYFYQLFTLLFIALIHMTLYFAMFY